MKISNLKERDRQVLISDLRQDLAKRPDDPGRPLIEAEILLLELRLDEAEQVLRAHLAKENCALPGMTYMHLWRIHREQGDRVAGIEALQQAQRYPGTAAMALAAQAEVQLEQGSTGEATALLDAATQALATTDAVVAAEIVSIAGRMPGGDPAARIRAITMRFPSWREYLEQSEPSS